MFAITIISFLFFTGLVALGTWLIVRGKESSSKEGFFLAGRSLTFPFIAGSLLLTNLSTEQMVGLNGSAFAEGWFVMVWEVAAVLGLVLMSWFFLPRFLRAGVATVPEYLAMRFNRRTGAICNLLFMCVYTFILLPTVLYSGAVGLMGIFNLPELTGIQNLQLLLWLTVIAVGLLGTFYALFGGLRTVAVSDLLNGIGLLIGGFMIVFFALNYVGGGAGILAGLNKVYQSDPARFNSLGPSGSSVPFHTVFSGVLIVNLFYWCTNQQIIQRTFGASSLAEGQKGVLLCGLLKLLGPLYLVLPGMIAFYLFSKNGIKADHAYGQLVHLVLPAPLTGFFAAVMIGAILSSFNSVLNSTCTLFSLGFYREFIKPQAGDAELVVAGKYFGWTAAVLSMITAPFLSGTASIFNFLKMMNSTYAVPVFSVVLIAMLTKKVPAFAANFALAAGCLIMLFFNIFRAPVNFYHVGGIVFVLLIAGMLLAGILRPENKSQLAEITPPVDMTPWKHVVPAGIILLILLILSFVILAK